MVFFLASTPYTNTFWFTRIGRNNWWLVIRSFKCLKNNFWQRISWFSHRWRTQRIAISNVNCRSESSNLWTHLALPADLIWGACLFEGRELFRADSFFNWKRVGSVLRVFCHSPWLPRNTLAHPFDRQEWTKAQFFRSFFSCRVLIISGLRRQRIGYELDATFLLFGVLLNPAHASSAKKGKINNSSASDW